ncbi:MAG TPA: hypothetical protein VEC37_11620 [Bacillota bacterium]|nr:hypothetical protein [Bacillota bacterium]
MKKLQWILLTGLVLLMTGFTKAPAPMEGVYDLKLKTLTLFELGAKNVPLLSVFAELTESKPEGLTVKVDTKKLTEPTFGSVKLGNTARKTWFLMGKDEQGFWTEIYLDQNGDQQITANEQIKSLQTYQGKERKLDRQSTYTLIPVPIRVAIMGYEKEVFKKIYFFFNTDIFTNKGESITMVSVFNASFLEGEMKVALGKEIKLVKFRIFDIDSNGCYNDFGEDMIYMDSNYDGLFKKKEGLKLTEFFDFGSDKTKIQYRLVLPPQPAKLAVIEALKDFNRSSLEAASDPEDDDTTEKPKQ